MTDITIYHNPACGTSRNTLALIRSSPSVRTNSMSLTAA
jgi:arsenate reductase-like glutaredoxin family protein